MNNNSNYTVYMHISPSNKRYIGITCQTINKRWQNGKGYPNNKHFTSAINLYGWENFQHIIIAKGLTEEQAKQMEIELIAKYDTTNQDKGYNMTLGGESGNGMKHTEEWKKQHSKRMSGSNNPFFCNPNNYHPTQETRDKISKALSGEGNPNYGRCGELHPMYGKSIFDFMTEEQIEQWKANMSKANSGSNHPRATKVIAIIDNKPFACFNFIKQGSEYFNINNSGDIGRCCKGDRKSCGKYNGNSKIVWRYLETIEL